MPWKECSPVSEREEFVGLAKREGANVARLCERFGISRKCGYKWLARFVESGRPGLDDRSRRPASCPWRTPAAIERKVLAMRDENPTWSGRKLRARLLLDGIVEAPAASTVTAILRRHGRLDTRESEIRKELKRFEREEPNELWQMDFKGHFRTSHGRCHPLTVIDDHSRFAVCVAACGDEREQSVVAALTTVFRRYGLPERMLMDNGSCWGQRPPWRFTKFSAWLIRIGIAISHPRPYHPQTQGKNERFNRTLKCDVISNRRFHDLAHCQQAFDSWREIYNLRRPHEALGLEVPASRYQVSVHEFPQVLPPVEYNAGDIVRKVFGGGEIALDKRRFYVGKAFAGCPVALRPSEADGVYDVYYCHQRIAGIDLNEPEGAQSNRSVGGPPLGEGPTEQPEPKNRWHLTRGKC